MVRIKIDKERCKGCMYCITFCKFGAISSSGAVNKKGSTYAVVSAPDKCKACGMCVMMCPDCCIEITDNGKE